jgi:transcriptional regulator of arginine metabolism
MHKANRLLAIESIISEFNVSTQEELLKRLKGKGIACTQATLSRNLRQLGVSRIPDGTGNYIYSLSGNSGKNRNSPIMLNIVPVIQDIVEAKGLMVIKTIPGNASNTAFFIDGAGRYEIAGTIAGDDTILLIPRDGITLKQVHTSLEIILPGIHEQVRKNRL